MTDENGSDKVLKALNWQPQKKITQAAFDEAVQESIDALGLEPDEAVEAAAEDFALRKVDLSDIIQTPAGGSIAGHSVIRTSEDVRRSITQPLDAAMFERSSSKLMAQFTDEAKQQENLAVALQGGVLHLLLHLAAKDPLSEGMVCKLLDLCTAAMQLVTIRDAFSVTSAKVEGQKCNAPFVVAGILRAHSTAANVVQACAALCLAAATGAEDTQNKLVESTFPRTALDILARGEVPVPVQATLCTAIKALMTHDDARPPASQAFMNARLLALDKGAVPVFLTVLRRAMDDSATLHIIISALQQLCANEEICLKVCDDDGVNLVMEAMDKHFEHAPTVATTCGLLRQLAKSDSVKRHFVSIDGFNILHKLLEAHKSSVNVCTQALGVMATVLLRQPEHCEAANANQALMAEVTDTMFVHRDSASVMRQACQLVRNLVVRNPELREPTLKSGVEPVLRDARKLPDCSDVGRAALRDLGLDNYND